MNVLAFDTCLGAVSVAVRWQAAPGEWLLQDVIERRTSGHAERLMPMIDEVMTGAGLAFSDLDRLAVTVGPGSFTGVRVGVAAARGLALASGLPVVGATSLAVMAHQADLVLGEKRRGRWLIVAVNAQRGMVYVQLFAPSGGESGAPSLQAPAEIAALLGARTAIVVGSGAASLVTAMMAAGGEAEAHLAELQPHASSLAVLADTLTPKTPVRPLYLRPPDVRPQDMKVLSRAASP